MTQLIEAADAVRKAARNAELLIVAANALERIGSLENAERETRARVEKAKDEETALSAQLDAARAKVEAALAEAVQVTTQAAQEAEARFRDAKKAADDYHAGAKADIEAREARSKEALEAMQRSADQIKRSTQEGTAEAQKVLAEVGKDLAERRAELSQVEEQLARLKAEARKFAG